MDKLAIAEIAGALDAMAIGLMPDCKDCRIVWADGGPTFLLIEGYQSGSFSIEFCPLHASAPKLRDALRELLGAAQLLTHENVPEICFCYQYHEGQHSIACNAARQRFIEARAALAEADSIRKNKP